MSFLASRLTKLVTTLIFSALSANTHKHQDYEEVKSLSVQCRSNILSRIASLQNRALRIIYFQQYNFNANILYPIANILPFHAMVQYINGLFVWDQQHSNLPTVCERYFLGREGCGHNLRSVTNNNLTVPLKQTSKYGINSITYQCMHVYMETAYLMNSKQNKNIHNQNIFSQRPFQNLITFKIDIDNFIIIFFYLFIYSLIIIFFFSVYILFIRLFIKSILIHLLFCVLMDVRYYCLKPELFLLCK